MIVERILAHRKVTDPPASRGSFVPLPKVVCQAPVPTLPSIDALVLDVGGVLYDDTCWWRWLAQVISHAGIRVRHDVLWEDWESAYLRLGTCDEQTFWDSLRQCLHRLGLSACCCDEIQAAASAQRKQWESTLLAFPGVDSTLRDLALLHVPIDAVVGPCSTSEQLWQRLRILSLASYFDHAISAGDHGCSLLDTSFYQQLVRQRGWDAERVALVSSKPRHLYAARRCGWIPIAVSCLGNFRTDFCLGHLANLPGQLRYRCNRQAA